MGMRGKDMADHSSLAMKGMGGLVGIMHVLYEDSMTMIMTAPYSLQYDMY
jgi:hypothetical protein